MRPAPCFSYTVRTTQGGEYSASRLNVEALDPATREWALVEVYEGRWLVQATIETTADAPRPGMPHVERRAERLAHRVDTRAAGLLDARLSLGATTADDVYDGDQWQVIRDPEGNEFCIV